MAIKITINGKEEEIDKKITLAELLHKKKVRVGAVVVRLNDKIVDKKDYNSINLQDGDSVEYLYYMGGGSR